MFYLKYRPQTLEEIDNHEVRERLKKTLAVKQIPHALLLAGPKGTGKTSTGRIVAKAINCEENAFAQKTKAIEPCNVCRSCRLITAGTSVDVVEIDAASARKIDDIRDLIDKVKFLPIYNRYKIYIVDEVHMLTREAFNAFLKTLEEPPSSTIFILATTEPEELPATVISRCLRINFHKAKIEEIIRMLKRISQQEKINFFDEVFELIARHSDHSFRDGAKLLETVWHQQATAIEDVRALLGMGKEDTDLLRLLETRELKKSLEFVERFHEQAGNCQKLIELTLDKLHALLLKKNKVVGDEVEDYHFSLKEIILLIRLFQEAYNMIHYSPIETLPLEIAINEYCEHKGGAK